MKKAILIIISIAIILISTLLFLVPKREKQQQKEKISSVTQTSTPQNVQPTGTSPQPTSDDGLGNFPKATATDFTLQKYDGSGSVNLATFYSDKPTIIQFWATWCEICRAEFPQNNAIVAKYKDKIHYIAVDWAQSDTDAVKKYIEELTLDPSVITFVMDGDGSVGAQYGIRGTPMHVFIKKGGQVLLKQTGKVSPQGFTYLIEKLINP